MAEALPKFYERWLGAANHGPSDAGAFDCTSCFMLAPRGFTRDLGPFRASLKCCTFHPYLPSFTIGALLKRELDSASGAASLAHYLRSSRLTPLGATPQKNWKPTSICETGKSAADACGFLSQDGQAVCTIRDFRPSTCAAYVCRSSKGKRGLSDWREWEASLAKFETTLAHLVSFELGYTMDDCESEFDQVDLAIKYYRRAYEVAGDIEYVED